MSDFVFHWAGMKLTLYGKNNIKNTRIKDILVNFA